jgi:hypothetical protein
MKVAFLQINFDDSQIFVTYVYELYAENRKIGN